MAQGEFTKEEAAATEQAFKEVYSALSPKKQAEFLGHANDIFLFLDAAKKGSALREPFDVVFDGPPGPEAGRFVEVEDLSGKSVSVGAWIDRGNGLWALRFA